jgi:hypothetical protein
MGFCLNTSFLFLISTSGTFALPTAGYQTGCYTLHAWIEKTDGSRTLEPRHPCQRVVNELPHDELSPV